MFIEAQVNGYPCKMIVDTGANVFVMRQDLAHQLGGKILWTPPCVTLKTVKGDQIPIVGKMNIKIQFGNAFYDHTVFVAEISDSFILGLDFLRRYNFVIDLKNNFLHSILEDVTLFHPETIKIKVSHQVISQEDISIPVRREIILEGAAYESKTFLDGLIELSANENFP